MVASRNAEVNVHAQSLTQPHSDIVVAKKGLRRVALKKCDDVSICSHQMLSEHGRECGRVLALTDCLEEVGSFVETVPTAVVVAKVVSPDGCTEVRLGLLHFR